MLLQTNNTSGPSFMDEIPKKLCFKQETSFGE